MRITRRTSLVQLARTAAATSIGGSLASSFSSVFDANLAHAAEPPRPKKVAAVVTLYRRNSHADVILGKILEGWKHDGGPGPALQLASLYVDQFPADDLARDLCRKFNVPLCDSIEQAVTVGSNGIPVDGVLSIGEHGDYPYNERGQQLYPRRRFFEQIAATFEKHGRVVPVFNDKHLGPLWEDALWMYERAKQLNIPFLAGSSLPVGFRTREVDLPLHADLEAAVGIGYSGLEVYGIHALEFYQWHVERRRGGESGVRRVRCLRGERMWQAVDSGLVSQEALDAAFAATAKPANADLRKDDKAALFLFDYTDGFQGAVFMLSCVHGTSVGLKFKGGAAAGKPTVATSFDERSEPRFPHFAYLLKAIERMIHTGKPPYPVERTLLTSGILDRVMRSHANHGATLETPELEIRYRPVDYRPGPHVDLLANPND